MPVAVEGIFATSLSVDTSQRSSYYTLPLFDANMTYLGNLVAHLHVPLIDGGLFSSFTQIGQLDVDRGEGHEVLAEH